MTPQELASIPQGETEYQAWIVDLLRLGGWWVDHTPDSRRNLASGAFDLLCIKPPRLVFVEVKRGGKRPGVVSAAQRAMDAMLTACGVEHYIVWPKDADLIRELAGAPVIDGNPYGER